MTEESFKDKKNNERIEEIEARANERLSDLRSCKEKSLNALIEGKEDYKAYHIKLILEGFDNRKYNPDIRANIRTKDMKVKSKGDIAILNSWIGKKASEEREIVHKIVFNDTDLELIRGYWDKLKEIQEERRREILKIQKEI